MKYDIHLEIDDTKPMPAFASFSIKNLKTGLTIEAKITNLNSVDESIAEAMDMIKNVASSIKTQ